jgi:hypothetical protein
MDKVDRKRGASLYKATTVYTAIMVTVIVILLIHGGHA